MKLSSKIPNQDAWTPRERMNHVIDKFSSSVNTELTPHALTWHCPFSQMFGNKSRFFFFFLVYRHCICCCPNYEHFARKVSKFSKIGVAAFFEFLSLSRRRSSSRNVSHRRWTRRNVCRSQANRFFPQKNPHISNVTQQCWCSPMVIHQGFIKGG